jgi:hypothetical protein
MVAIQKAEKAHQEVPPLPLVAVVVGDLQHV